MTENQINNILNNYQTPLYVFDIKTLTDRVKHLKTILPTDISLCYAVKANTFVVNYLSRYVEKLELCSPGELLLCLENGIDIKKFVISGVYKSEDYINDMMFIGNEVNSYTVESFGQYRMLNKIANSECQKIKVLLRLTSGNQFGLNENEIIKIIGNQSENLVIKGLQYYSGTQKISLKKIKREIDYLDNFLQKLKNEFGFEAQELEYGPGFPIAYFKNDSFDESEYLKIFSQYISSMNFKGKITLEIGRSLVAGCGSYMTKIVDMKNNLDQNYAIVDGGINHITYYGQSMAMKHPYHQIYPKRFSIKKENWNICGSLCTTNDILMKNVPFENLKIGDTIIFENTGAYCMTEGISLFLSRALPQVLIIKEENEITCARAPVSTYKLNKIQDERNIEYGKAY